MNRDPIYEKEEWRSAVRCRQCCYLQAVCLVLILAFAVTAPHFFKHIEQRNGHLIHDPLLFALPPHNVSLPIFLIIWTTVALFIVRAVKQPTVFLYMLTAYTIFTYVRMVVLFLIPLEPPIGIVELRDPVTSVFYGGCLITKDLFFSGHLGTEVLFLLVFTKKIDRMLVSFFCVALACLLLVQHVHYTFDVLAAPVFSFISYWIAKKIIARVTAFKLSSQPVDLPMQLGKAS